MLAKICRASLRFAGSHAVSIHINILSKVAFETNHLESPCDENKSWVEMLTSMQCCRSAHPVLHKSSRGFLFAYINYVVLKNKLKKATSLRTARNDNNFLDVQ